MINRDTLHRLDAHEPAKKYSNCRWAFDDLADDNPNIMSCFAFSLLVMGKFEYMETLSLLKLSVSDAIKEVHIQESSCLFCPPSV